jgi:hypothetical protein
MVQLTERACQELERLLRDHLAGARQGVRLGLDPAGHLKMTIDGPHLGDSVVRRGAAPLLIVDARLSRTLGPRVLDFPGPLDGRPSRGFVLGWRPPEVDGPSAATFA